MARPKPWFPQIAKIINVLEASEDSSFTRADIEEVFQIRRSAAVALMKVAGNAAHAACTAKATVSRENLLSYLRYSPEAQDAMQELTRRANLAHKLKAAGEDAKLKAVVLPVTSADEWCTLQDLPNVSIEPGMLRVAFSDPKELMADLWRLCKAAGGDWGAFERACGSGESRKGADQ